MADLQLFQLRRAIGGIANDADSLEASFSYKSEAELRDFFKQVDITLQEYGEKPDQPIPGKSYKGSEMAKFVSLIPQTTYIAQPGRCQLAGVDTFIWVTSERVTITVNASLNSGYTYADKDFEKAAELEKALLPMNLPWIKK